MTTSQESKEAQHKRSCSLQIFIKIKKKKKYSSHSTSTRGINSLKEKHSHVLGEKEYEMRAGDES